VTADNLLAGPVDHIDVHHLLAEHQAATDELRRLRGQLHQRDIRADALAAAATWLTGIDPWQGGDDFVLRTAERFATWIETGDRP
jgi:hypothetical protein